MKEMKNMSNQLENPLYLASVRMWSEDVQLVSVAESLDWPRTNLHVKGFPVRYNGVLNNRIAARHYVALEDEKFENWNGVTTWIGCCLGRFSKEDWIKPLLRSSKIEAVFWITIIDTGTIPKLKLGRDVKNKIDDLNIGIKIDNMLKNDILS